MPELPDVPSAAEAGFPQLATTNWWMVAAPAGTPPAIVDRFGGEIRSELKNAEVRKRLAAVGQAPMELSPVETSAFLRAESARYKTIVEKGGVTRQ
jgi:tripartite-type tricarboxylate transporter receptor subunit TctC